MNRKIKVLIFIIIVLIGAALVWWGTKPSAQNQAVKGGPGTMRQLASKQGQPVAVATAVKGTMPVYLTGLGTVTPSNTVTVTSRVEGQLMKLHFQEGQLVKAGQLLAEIDARPFQAALTQAQGQLAKDQAALSNARVDLARYQTLVAQDSASKQQLDTQKSLVKQYEASVKAGQGSVSSARLQVEYSRITAPISGRVGLRKVDPGNLVKANDTTGLVVITQISPIDVIFTLPQTQLGSVLSRLQAGEQPVVDVWDQGMKMQLAAGHVSTIDNQIDISTGTVKIKGVFDNADGLLFPNQFVNVRMHVEDVQDAVLVPNNAVQHGRVGDFVWVINAENKVNVRTVTRGASDGKQTVLLTGLKAGEMVVTDGVERLREDALVIPTDPETAQQEAQKAAGEKKASRNRNNANKKAAQ
ncbi:MdtA/MuxA family multidrug efflux RND transporter periplasmic adaptor subunit [Neisseria sp. Ec49-e6-T10]|uniref:MdtA/MuxA family multidrug efflux RND transporter periplasmic adaptor subunit n=1 Tax=Neisseria sp. Ec49-e6-T10 TaxID=3140744 RepID=UPI003EC0A4FB